MSLEVDIRKIKISSKNSDYILEYNLTNPLVKKWMKIERSKGRTSPISLGYSAILTIGEAEELREVEESSGIYGTPEEVIKYFQKKYVGLSLFLRKSAEEIKSELEKRNFVCYKPSPVDKIMRSGLIESITFLNF